jgi:hypothetical protein
LLKCSLLIVQGLIVQTVDASGGCRAQRTVPLGMSCCAIVAAYFALRQCRNARGALADCAERRRGPAVAQVDSSVAGGIIGEDGLPGKCSATGPACRQLRLTSTWPRSHMQWEPECRQWMDGRMYHVVHAWQKPWQQAGMLDTRQWTLLVVVLCEHAMPEGLRSP